MEEARTDVEAIVDLDLDKLVKVRHSAGEEGRAEEKCARLDDARARRPAVDREVMERSIAGYVYRCSALVLDPLSRAG